MSKRYVLIRDGEPEGVILWDGVTPYDPGPDASLVEEAKYQGPPPAAPEREATVEERLTAQIETLKAQMAEVAKVPEVRAKVDLAQVKSAAELELVEIAEPVIDVPVKGR